MQRTIVKLENLLIALVCGLFYMQTQDAYYLNFNRWYLIILVWLSVDLSMVGYLANKKIGSLVYNLFHNYILAASLMLVSYFIHIPDILAVSLILFVHIGIDRFLGFGLKYPSDFKHTHIQKL